MISSVAVEIRHPAHIHYFKHALFELEKRGVRVRLFAVDKEIVLDLLQHLSFDFEVIDTNRAGKVRKIVSIGASIPRMLLSLRHFRPDVMMGMASPTFAFASRLLGVPYVPFSDTEHASLTWNLTLPFVDVVHTPAAFQGDLQGKRRIFNGFLEQGYTEPMYEARPPASSRSRPVAIVRFVRFAAIHDEGFSGMSDDEKIALVQMLADTYDVQITSENAVPEELRGYVIRCAPHELHGVMAEASLFVGESTTMATEASLLGVPSLVITPLAKLCGNQRMLQDTLGLQQYFDDFKSARSSLLAHIEQRETNERVHRERLDAFYQQSENVTAYMICSISEAAK